MAILIVGCGAMGSFIAHLLKERGFEILLHDKDRGALVKTRRALKARALTSLEGGLTDIEGAVVAVPIDSAPTVIRGLSRLLSRDAWIMEIASFKSPIQPAIRYARKKGLTCVSAHPLFGPMTNDLAGTRTAHVSPAERDKERRILRMILRGTKIVEVDVERHDEAMGIGISLTHAIGLAAALLLSERDGTAIALSTKSLSLLSGLAAIALTESPSFYTGYTMGNKHATAAYSEFIRFMKRVTSKENRAKPHLIAAKARREVGDLMKIERIYREIYLTS